MDIATLLAQYGLAGIVIFIFYSLFRNELHDLKSEIARLRETIERFMDIIERKL